MTCLDQLCASKNYLTSYHKKRKYVYRSLVTLFHKEMQINYCIVLSDGLQYKMGYSVVEKVSIRGTILFVYLMS